MCSMVPRTAKKPAGRGQVFDAMLPPHLGTSSPSKRHRDDPHADLIRHHHAVCGERQHIDEFIHIGEDGLRFLAGEQQVRQPERETIEDDDVVVAAAADGLRDGERLFEGHEVGTTILAVAGDACRHLVIAGLCRGQKQATLTQPPRQAEGEVALAETGAAADQDQLLGDKGASE